MLTTEKASTASPPSIEQLKQLLTPVCRMHGINGVEIYGSVARGDARSGSDIDLIIHMLDDKEVSYFDLFDMQEAFSKAAGVPVQLMTDHDYERIGNPYLLISINKDRRVLLEPV